MKRRTLKVLACATMMAMTLSVTACGSGDAAETTETVEEDAEVEEAEEAEVEEEVEAEVEEEVEEEAEEAEEAAEEVAEEEEATSGEATTLEEYYNDPTVKAMLDSAFESLAEDGMSASIEMEENTMTVIIKIEDESMMVDGMGEYLDAALDASADQFAEQAATFDEIIGESGACTVVMRYLDPDDNVISEKSFTAQ